MLALVTGTGSALASTRSINFEPPAYTPDTSIDGQDGWAGSGGSAINPNIDQEVALNTTTDPNFDLQDFRISNSFTSGGFGDWVYSPSLADAAGDSDAVGHGGGLADTSNLQRHFDVNFDLRSADTAAVQPGMGMTISPDRGDGARMSWLRVDDVAGGLKVSFSDYQDVAPLGSTGTPVDGCSGSDDF